ncbi:DNA-directed RNA polymerase subunit epsilon [Halorhabdus sp. CBA1104]|uniref:DNA-directed RNA polymerase subunit epsilon n=1 Tax=unclassified Halorhabdus TaxID=2621901 RepID=UPI0012B38A5A|nr:MULTISPECIES: DNA-directed RNA polymerase subunit epsilon [unclassified Halorhabdus]QGN07688.1 DNA-directed RNA polymerase subunit epsilon [Halorhabdus sp. CBA1104]
MNGEGVDSSGQVAEPAERERREWRKQRDVSAEPGDGALSRAEARRDELIRQWDMVTPSATTIGRPDRPGDDLDDSLRRLHNEQHPAMAGHAERMHRLDKARITHALCNALDLTPWERDRVLGIVTEIDLTAFGSQRAIPKVALVVIQHVVDSERQGALGLDDPERLAALTPDEMASLYDHFQSITDDERYRQLIDSYGLDMTSVNRLDRVLDEQLDEQGLRDAVFGRSGQNVKRWAIAEESDADTA